PARGSVRGDHGGRAFGAGARGSGRPRLRVSDPEQARGVGRLPVLRHPLRTGALPSRPVVVTAAPTRSTRGPSPVYDRRRAARRAGHVAGGRGSDLPPFTPSAMTPRVEGRVYAAPIPHSLAELEAQFDAAAARPRVEGDAIVFA